MVSCMSNQMTDLNCSVEEVKGYSRTNAKDILAVGFDSNRTFIFSVCAELGNAISEMRPRPRPNKFHC